VARLFAGGPTPVETVVYGPTAAFGREFLLAFWRELWRHG
jgi:hypothetical protein